MKPAVSAPSMSPSAPVAGAQGQPRPTLKTWVMAIRPKTLTAALVPVSVGTGLAFGAGVGRWLPALAALLGALLIQIGTNLTNDYYDFKKGADTEERLGPGARHAERADLSEHGAGRAPWGASGWPSSRASTWCGSAGGPSWRLA